MFAFNLGATTLMSQINTAITEAHLSPYLLVWSTITTDTCALSIVAKEYTIEFIQYLPTPHFVRMPYLPLHAEVVQVLLAKQAIEPVPPSAQRTGIYPHYFAVPKKDGGIPPIMDLWDLNKFVVYQKFQMTYIQSILSLLEDKLRMVTLDLQEASFHISIRESHRRFLRFMIGDDHYQFQVFPLGIVLSLRVFTKTMVVVVAHVLSESPFFCF